jgi:hypothetical protein
MFVVQHRAVNVENLEGLIDAEHVGRRLCLEDGVDIDFGHDRHVVGVPRSHITAIAQ